MKVDGMLNGVLIVDDDNVSNFIAERVIKSHGQVRMVMSVTDGRQALNYLKRQCEGDDAYACPELILLDLNMPYIDGMEFLNNKGKYGVPDDIPVVVVTGLEPSRELERQLKDMGVGYVIKPLTGAKFDKIYQESGFKS